MQLQSERLNRVFFKELLASDFFSINSVLVTPTCARCSRLFGIGELKKEERRGNITNLKISDSTATLNIYTNKTIRLQEPEKDFMAFVGKLHVRADKGRGFIILVEEAAAVNEEARNNWILTTAKRTMERIEQLRRLEKNALAKKHWAREAIEHYAIDDDRLDALADMAINAVRNVLLYYSKTAGEIILEVLEAADKNGMKREKLTTELEKKGLTGESIEEALEYLIAEGSCYEPEVGIVRVVEQ